jgi:glutathione synthase/RimK-type ligase-like ATP-grasp enzyme
MNARIAIHERPGSFSDRWLEACREKGISHAPVNCYEGSIVEQLASYDALLWHHSHTSIVDSLLAGPLIRCAESMGLVVFPDSPTSWHFNDKIAQKYLLESVGAPLVPTHVFYDRDIAMRWVDKTTYPQVFKLRRGASSYNVLLVRTPAQARKLIDRSFGRGHEAQPRPHADLRSKMQAHRRQGDILAAVRRFPRTARAMLANRRAWPREKGYVYFQDFVPGNDTDTRVVIIGDRGMGFTRSVRRGDFRASGSRVTSPDPDLIDPRCLKIGFDVSRRIGAQCMAYDFVHDQNRKPLILEISYGFLTTTLHACPGYWDRNLNFREKRIYAEDAILEDVLESVATGERVDGHSHRRAGG